MLVLANSTIRARSASGPQLSGVRQGLQNLAFLGRQREWRRSGNDLDPAYKIITRASAIVGISHHPSEACDSA